MKKKKLVICASASFEDEIVAWKNKLEVAGFDVIKYPGKIKENFLENYKKEFTEHYDALSKTDVVLALNLEKRGVAGYIGSSVFAEMVFAIGLNRNFNKNIEVCYLNPIPEKVLPFADELELWQQLGWIKLFDTKNMI